MIEYIVFATAASEIGDYAEAVNYLNSAESATKDNTRARALVKAVKGHFYYETSAEPADNTRAYEEYDEALKLLKKEHDPGYRADLYAQWTLDAYIAGDSKAPELAKGAYNFYKSIPSARRTRLRPFIDRLQQFDRNLAARLRNRLEAEERQAENSVEDDLEDVKYNLDYLRERLEKQAQDVQKLKRPSGTSWQQLLNYFWSIMRNAQETTTSLDQHGSENRRERD